MLSFNLEEAIDTVPPRIADIPAKSKGFQTDFPVRQHESTLASGKSSNEKSKGNTATAAKMESILSRWSDRASIQSFMRAISSLKQKQELKQQQQNKEMYDKFRQIMQQQHQRQQQQQQQQGNTLNTQTPTSNQNSTAIFPNDSTLLLNEPKTSITTQANQKPKFRKVMKGGVLVTMPINARHPPGRTAVEQSSGGQGGSFTNKDKRIELGCGNILDDILARSMRNEVKSNLTRKKAVETTKAVDLKVREKERVCNRAGGSQSTCELRNSVDSCEIITISNASDSKSNVNLRLTTSLSCQEQQKVLNDESEISQKNNNPKSEGQRDTKRLVLSVSPPQDKGSSDSSQLNIPMVNSNLNQESNLQQFKIVTKVDNSESGQAQKPVVISAEQNGARPCELNSKLHNIPSQNPDNNSKNLPNMSLKIESDKHCDEEAFNNVSKPDVDTESYETNLEKSPDNSRQGSMNQNIKPDTEMLSPGDLVIEEDSDSELHTRSQRAAKKLRYSSLTSESSDSESEKQLYSSFDQIRSLCVDQKANKSIEMNDVLNTDKGNKQPNAIEPSGSSYHLTNEKQEETSLPPAQNYTIENVDVNADKTMKGKSFEEEHGAGEKKNTRANQRKRRTALNRKKAESKNRLKQHQKEERLERRRENYNGRITRSMSHSDVELAQTKINQKRRASRERPEETVLHFAQQERTPSLLSMVSNETVDITVAQQEVSDQRKKRRGGKKKKKKQPTEWYLRQKRIEKEMLERRKQSQQQAPREPPICAYFRSGKCPKGSTCQFKHEKIKELCCFYASRSKICEKFLDGMCPKMHSEFPCMFFHRKRHCSNGNTCKFSHAPLTDETREILDKYIAAFQESRQPFTTDPISENTPNPPATIFKPTQAKNESSISSRTNPSAVTNVNTSHPQETTLSDVGCFKGSKPASGLKSTSATLQVRKPVIENPKVRRLCSLSTYKPPPLSSLFTTLQSRGENVPSARKGFLPGMFKER